MASDAHAAIEMGGHGPEQVCLHTTKTCGGERDGQDRNSRIDDVDERGGTAASRE